MPRHNTARIGKEQKEISGNTLDLYCIRCSLKKPNNTNQEITTSGTSSSAFVDQIPNIRTRPAQFKPTARDG